MTPHQSQSGLEETKYMMLFTYILSFSLVVCYRAGADFTNTFRSLSHISCPSEGESDTEEGLVRDAANLLLEQCASLEELKAANKPTMDPRWAA